MNENAETQQEYFGIKTKEVGEYINNKNFGVCKQSVKEADRLILEYMQKRNLTIEDLQENVFMQQEPNDAWDETVTLKRTYWYKGELIFCIKQKYDIKQPLIARAEMVIEKGNW